MSIKEEHPTRVEHEPNEISLLGLKANKEDIACFDLAPSYKRKVTSAKLTGTFTASLHYENDQADQDLGKPSRLIYHWSAGTYTQAWDGYHYGIGFDTKTKKAVVLRFLTIDQKGKHLWGRNGGSVGVSFLAMADKHPVTKEQVLAAARLGAELCAWRQIDPRAKETVPQMTCDKSASNIWTTGKQIVMPTVTDHTSYAKQDGYGAWRIDIGDKFVPVYHELLAIYDALKAGKDTFQFKNIL